MAMTIDLANTAGGCANANSHKAVQNTETELPPFLPEPIAQPDNQAFEGFSGFTGTTLGVNIHLPMMNGRSAASISPDSNDLADISGPSAWAASPSQDCAFDGSAGANQATQGYWTYAADSVDQAVAAQGWKLKDINSNDAVGLPPSDYPNVCLQKYRLASTIQNLQANCAGLLTQIDQPSEGVLASVAAEYYVLEGGFHMAWTESLADVRSTSGLTRVIQSGFRFRVRFQKSITVTSDPNVRVFAPIRLLGAIEHQEVKFTTDRYSVYVQLYFQTQYPFQVQTADISNAQITALNNQMFELAYVNGVNQDSASKLEPSADPQNLNQVSCNPSTYCDADLWLQFEQTNAAAPSDATAACELDLTSFQVDVTFGCSNDYLTQASAPQCPIGSNDPSHADLIPSGSGPSVLNNSGRILFDIKTANWCSGVELSVDLTGTLKSYLSVNYAQLRNAFIRTQHRVYWEAHVTSNNVAITAASLVAAEINRPSTGAWIPLSNAVGDLQTEATVGDGQPIEGQKVRYHHDLSDAVLSVSDVPQDQYRAVQARATISVTFAGTRKRGVARQAADTADTAVQATVGIQSPAATTTTTTKTAQPATTEETPMVFVVSIVAVFAALLACCAGLGLLAFFMTRKQQSNANTPRASVEA